MTFTELYQNLQSRAKNGVIVATDEEIAVYEKFLNPQERVRLYLNGKLYLTLGNNILLPENEKILFSSETSTYEGGE